MVSCGFCPAFHRFHPWFLYRFRIFCSFAFLFFPFVREIVMHGFSFSFSVIALRSLSFSLISIPLCSSSSVLFVFLLSAVSVFHAVITPRSISFIFSIFRSSSSLSVIVLRMLSVFVSLLLLSVLPPFFLRDFKLFCTFLLFHPSRPPVSQQGSSGRAKPLLYSTWLFSIII